MPRISFDTLVPDSTVSVYSDGRVDAVELAMVVSEKTRDNAGKQLRNLNPKHFNPELFAVLKLPGKGNLTTKTLHYLDAVKLVMVLPGNAAKETRAKFANIITRYFAGDASLHSEIDANATSKNPICTMAREALHASSSEKVSQKKRSADDLGKAIDGAAGEAGVFVKRLREASSVVHEVQPVTMAIKQDMRDAGLIMAKAQPVVQVMKRAAGELKENIVEVSAVMQAAQPILMEMTSALETAKPLMVEMKAVMGEIQVAAGAYERILDCKKECHELDETDRAKQLEFIQAKAKLEAQISRQVNARELEYLEVARVKELEFLKAKALVEAEAIAIVAKAKAAPLQDPATEGLITVKSVAEKYKLLESVEGQDQNRLLSQAGRCVATKIPFSKGMVLQGQFHVCGYDLSDEPILVAAIKEAVLGAGTKGPLKITDVSHYCTLNSKDKSGRKAVFNAAVSEMKAYLRENEQPILGKEGNHQTFAADNKDKLIEILRAEQKKYLASLHSKPSTSGLVQITQIFKHP